MNDDIKIIKELLDHRGRKDLSTFLDSSVGEVEQTSQFGSYWNSVVSFFNIYLPVDSFVESKSISAEDRKIILEAVLDLYPHEDNSVEIQNIFFLIQREDKNNETGNGKDDARLGDRLNFEKDIKIQYSFLEDQITKAQELFDKGDFAGVLTCVKSALEATTFDIFRRITGEKIYTSGSLKESYKKIKNLLNLAPENKTNASAKKLNSSLISIIDAIDELSNSMGDRHVQKVIPERHHALLCLNSGMSVIEFLYSSLIYQYEGKDTIYQEIIDFLYKSNNRSKTKEDLLEEPELKFIFNRCDEFTKGLIKKKLISEFAIDHFKDSDVFFKILDLLGNINEKKDITFVEKKCSGNNQACGLKNFLETYDYLK